MATNPNVLCDILIIQGHISRLAWSGPCQSEYHRDKQPEFQSHLPPSAGREFRIAEAMSALAHEPDYLTNELVAIAFGPSSAHANVTSVILNSLPAGGGRRL